MPLLYQVKHYSLGAGFLFQCVASLQEDLQLLAVLILINGVTILCNS